MATKRELAEEAEALGVELGAEVTTRGLNFAEMTELVERLRAAKLDADAAAAANTAPPPPDAAPPLGAGAGPTAPPPEADPAGATAPGNADAPAMRSGRYRVATGRSITAQHGLMAEHERVLPRHFTPDVLQRLIKIGAIEDIGDSGPIE